MGDPSGSQRSVGGRRAGPSSPRPGPASSSDSRGRHPRPYRHLVARLLRTLRLAPAWPRLARLFSKEASAPPSSPSWAFAPAKCACCRSRARRRAPGHVPRGLTVTPNERPASSGPAPEVGGRAGAGPQGGTTFWDGRPGSGEDVSLAREPSPNRRQMDPSTLPRGGGRKGVNAAVPQRGRRRRSGGKAAGRGTPEEKPFGKK